MLQLCDTVRQKVSYFLHIGIEQEKHENLLLTSNPKNAKPNQMCYSGLFTNFRFKI